jgi:hypothetical protein
MKIVVVTPAQAGVHLPLRETALTMQRKGAISEGLNGQKLG